MDSLRFASHGVVSRMIAAGQTRVAAEEFGERGTKVAGGQPVQI
jgi:hypothetical protein